MLESRTILPIIIVFSSKLIIYLSMYLIAAFTSKAFFHNLNFFKEPKLFKGIKNYKSGDDALDIININPDMCQIFGRTVPFCMFLTDMFRE